MPLTHLIRDRETVYISKCSKSLRKMENQKIKDTKSKMIFETEKAVTPCLIIGAKEVSIPVVHRLGFMIILYCKCYLS